MAALTIGIRGLEEFSAKLLSTPSAIADGSKRGLAKAAANVLRRVKDPYMTARGVVGGPYLNRRTGTLVGLANMGQPEFADGDWQVRVGEKHGGADAYAPVHEFGTDRAGRNHNVRIPARAPFRNALKDMRDQTVATIKAEELAAIGRHFGAR